MADSQKNNIVVVVVVLLGIFSVPCNGFTQELQQYTNEIARRSFNVLEYFDSGSMMMRFGTPMYIIVTFIVAVCQVWNLISGYLPNLGWGSTLIGAPPTEMIQVREGDKRGQRRLEALDEQVQAAVAGGINEFENELKKKKK